MLPVDKLEKACAAAAEENIIFRSFLKERDAEEVDEIVHELHEELFAQFDCQACANCCKVISPTVKEKEIETISKHLGLSANTFRKSAAGAIGGTD